MRTKKVDLEYYKTLISNLSKKRNRTPEDEVNLAAFRKVVADEELRLAKETFEAAKKDALIKILTANGITTENALKAILAAAQSVSPDLVPGPAKEKKRAKKNEDAEMTDDTPETDTTETDTTDTTETEKTETGKNDRDPMEENEEPPTEEPPNENQSTDNENQSTDQ